jgi:uroporphyrinogen-III synthase
VPAEHTAAGLAALLGGEVAGRRILIPQGNLARGELGRILRERGAVVDTITVYATGSPDPSRTTGLPQRVLSKEFDAVVLSSPSAVTHFLSLFSAEEAALIPTRLTLAAIGPTTRDALSARGMAPHITATKPSAESVAEALDAFFY